MISRAEHEETETPKPPACIVLVRYGMVPQVARFSIAETLHNVIQDDLQRGKQLVVRTERGTELGSLLEIVRGVVSDDHPVTGEVERAATDDDHARQYTNARRANDEFADWLTRIEDWQLQLQLIDIEYTLDQEQVVLYVLNGQDAETTRLALLAAAAGLGIIHVQPVAAEGIVQASGGGGCGSGGCGSGGCGH